MPLLAVNCPCCAWYEVFCFLSRFTVLFYSVPWCSARKLWVVGILLYAVENPSLGASRGCFRLKAALTGLLLLLQKVLLWLLLYIRASRLVRECFFACVLCTCWETVEIPPAYMLYYKSLLLQLQSLTEGSSGAVGSGGGAYCWSRKRDRDSFIVWSWRMVIVQLIRFFVVVFSTKVFSLGKSRQWRRYKNDNFIVCVVARQEGRDGGERLVHVYTT